VPVPGTRVLQANGCNKQNEKETLCLRTETSSSAMKSTDQQTWEKDTTKRRKRPEKRKQKKEEKTIFLSEKMFNSFIETKKLKTKNNDER
jgi:hypothetical protein